MTANTNIKQLVMTGLMTALTCVATMVIRIPTPTMGYIHPGDGFVLLSGLLLGPVWGSLAAGLGSALADLISGYLIYVPATFLIKALTALVASLLFRFLQKKLINKNDYAQLILAGIVGELIMVFGYFVFETFLLGYQSAGAFSHAALLAGLVASAAGLVPNVMQGIFGVVFSTLLYPLLKKLIRA